MDFLIKVNPVVVSLYEKSMKSLRKEYQFEVVGDSSVEVGKYVVEDLTPDQKILPLFGIVNYKKSLKNRNTCMNPPAFFDGRCKKEEKHRCFLWEKCIFERRGKGK